MVVEIVSTPTPLLSNIDKPLPATEREDRKDRYSFWLHKLGGRGGVVRVVLTKLKSMDFIADSHSKKEGPCDCSDDVLRF